mgnify:CR=1 FL=1
MWHYDKLFLKKTLSAPLLTLLASQLAIYWLSLIKIIDFITYLLLY